MTPEPIAVHVPPRPRRRTGGRRPPLRRLALGDRARPLSWAAVTATVVTTATVLHVLGGLDRTALAGAVGGLVVGVLLCLPAGASLAGSRELADLACAADTLRWRARCAEELAERRRIEAATAAAGVQELVHGLVAAEEGARGQLAAELHDTVAQSLLLARGLLARSPLTPVELAALTDHLEDAEEQVRAVMARTRPPALRDGDLAEAVSCLRADLSARYALAVHVRWPSEPVPLPLAAAVTVYRFFQEALLNVVKHADVDEVDVALEVLPDGVVASVRDSGPGFELELVSSERGRSVGLGLLSERARLSGGRLEVSSGGGREGTLLRLWLPRPVQAPPAVDVPQQRRAG